MDLTAAKVRGAVLKDTIINEIRGVFIELIIQKMGGIVRLNILKVIDLWKDIGISRVLILPIVEELS